jgi:hypothetical protein
MVLVKTLRYEPGQTYYARDPSDNVVEIRTIDFKKEYPKHVSHKNVLVWITQEDEKYVHWIINPDKMDQLHEIKSTIYIKIVKMAISTIRNNKLSELGI